jgi:general secretion pathway protein G
MFRQSLKQNFVGFKNLSNQKGMTLLEIVIVVAILATLGSVLVGQVMKQLNKAKFSEAKLRMGQVSRALDMYYTDCGKYPGSLDALLEKDDCNNWGPESYLKSKKDLQDPWNTEIQYSISGSSFEIKSLGADRREGGEGNNRDISNIDE